MRRAARILAVFALAPLLMGGGGQFPPPAGFKVTGPAISATVVLEAKTEGQASIRLHKGTLYSGASFRMPNTFPLGLGCVLAGDGVILGLPEGADITQFRFGYNPPDANGKLLNWIPGSVISDLFTRLGISGIDGQEPPIPIITDVDNATCTPDVATGFLSFDAVIQFLVRQSGQ